MAVKHLRAQIYGSYYNPLMQGEEWTVGINFIQNDTDPSDYGLLPLGTAFQVSETGETDIYTWVNNWKTRFGGLSAEQSGSDLARRVATAWFGDVLSQSFVSDQCVTLGVKTYPINEAGHADGLVCDLTFKTPHRGAGTSGMAPLQCSLVSSWQTSVLGKHGKGRIYLPGLNRGVVEAWGEPSAGGQAPIASAMALFIHDASLVGTVPGLDVWCKPIVTSSASRNYGLIKTVRIGNVIDTQRRRRNNLVETYDEALVP